jgi:DNA-binding winged helix-turn-helix (wHTH) protein
VDTYERVLKGRALFWEGDAARIAEYLRGLKSEDPLAWSLLDAAAATIRSRFPEAVKKGTRLLPRVSGDPKLAVFLFDMLGLAYTMVGEMSAAENYYLRALEVVEKTGEPRLAAVIRMNTFNGRFYRAEYGSLYRDLKEFDLGPVPWSRHNINFFLSILETVMGKPDMALRRLEFLDEPNVDKHLWCGGMEFKGLALRFLDRLAEARACFLESTESFLDFGSAYSAFPCAKALELSRFAGLEPPPDKLIIKCLALARKGSWGEMAAAQEIEALLVEDETASAEGLYAAAGSYFRANQPVEACLVGLASAFCAWKTNNPVFPLALRLISPLVPLHPGFKRDPILGDFLVSIGPFLSRESRKDDKTGIRAHLTGELEVQVDGRDIRPLEWRSKRAARALIYLLLSPRHRVPRDHLFYLLWPRKKYIRKNAMLLYKAIYIVRENLGDSRFLTRRYDYYQLEGEVWTDLSEIENLIRQAEASQAPEEKEELLSRAREIAGGELLPEFPYDRYVDEYRQYYERLRKRVFKE